MRQLFSVMAILGGMAFIAGCDWTTGGGVDSWNSRYNWVNFSGVYRGLNGGVLVTDFTATPGTPGSTAVTIRSFTVFQEGEHLRIVDNNGATYTGRMGSIRTPGGDSAGSLPNTGATIIAQFNAEGVSASGVKVRMVGTFQGVIAGGAGTSFSMADRRMFGTWIESGGKTGDLNGQSSPVNLVINNQ